MIQGSLVRMWLTAGLSLCLVLIVHTVGSPNTTLRSQPERPHILLITVDTLRADRLGSYGYERNTSPNIDRLLKRGWRFSNARTVEPLTNPGLSSLLTSHYPHEHWATRNGLRIRTDLPSLPKELKSAGYTTAAFVANWTLRAKLSALDEHFDIYEGVFTKKRWFGLVASEATAADVNARAMDWVDDYLKQSAAGPLFLWVHYVEPHAPYDVHPEFTQELGVARPGGLSKSDKYDTEVAFVDHQIGRLLRWFSKRVSADELMIGFASDHGESLGEHDYWGHGRHIYEPGLSIPMGLVWKEHLEPATEDGFALIIDLAPTILHSLDLQVPESFRGYAWRSSDEETRDPPPDEVCFQAHKGAVLINHESDAARRGGLLEVGVFNDGKKEIMSVDSGELRVFDLADDPLETRNLVKPSTTTSDALLSCVGAIYRDLEAADRMPVQKLDEESIEQLRSLGYLD